jgi:hypothetical protein
MAGIIPAIILDMLRCQYPVKSTDSPSCALAAENWPAMRGSHKRTILIKL